MAKISSLSDLSGDEFLSELPDEENLEGIYRVSDGEYAEELQLQEVVIASRINTQMTKSDSQSSVTIQARLVPNLEAMVVKIKAEDGESSLRFCEICCDRKENDQMFNTENCVHSFCNDCLSKHVATKVQNRTTSFMCPGLDCKSILEFDACKPVLPKEVLDLWEEALCEELIDASQRFYCPFKDCSAMLVKENVGGEYVIKESECPICHRLFCAECYVPWHAGVECEEYQRLNVDERGREDLMLIEVSKEKKWSRCPHCKFYVERTEGCPHMTCRCKFEFC